MVEEIFVKAFITKIANNLYDLVFSKSNTDDDKVVTIKEEKVKLLIEQKLEEEVKTLKENNNEVKLLDAIRSSFVYRIHNVFAMFDIKLEEVPIFLEKFHITNRDVLYEENLLEKFDYKVIEYISHTLDINKDWLYGRTEEMIPLISHGYYKNSTFFCKRILDTQPSSVYILTEKTPRKKVDEIREDNYISIIVEYNNLYVNNRNISTYKVYNESCKYGYWRCRYELKRFILGFKKSHKTNILYGKIISNLNKKIYEFSKGKIDFDNLFSGSQMWYPTDYIELPEDSACAIADEADEARKIIDEYDTINNY